MVDTYGGSVYYVDRSGAETDDKCGMAFWMNRKEGGMGITAKEESIHLLIGRETHEDVAVIEEMEDIGEEAITALLAEITAPLTPQDYLVQETMEVLYRRLGWIAAYALYLEPRERAEWEHVAIEKEILLDRTPLWVAVTPDNLRRHRTDRYLKYREFKTTKYAGPGWINHWPYDIQIHLGILAAEEELSERVAYGQVIGLMKGEKRDGKLSHPYVWAWYSPSKDLWEHEYTKARGGDWERRPVWEFPGGIVEWVKRLGPEVGLAQFPHSAPVFLNERMVNEWVLSRTEREIEIASVQEACITDTDLRLAYFPRRTRNCRPAFGDPCPYLAACWNAEINLNPLLSGLYVPRVPHHAIELQLVGGGEELPNDD